MIYLIRSLIKIRRRAIVTFYNIFTTVFHFAVYSNRTKFRNQRLYVISIQVEGTNENYYTRGGNTICATFELAGWVGPVEEAKVRSIRIPA